MTRRLAELTLWLYPLAFRRRYGEELRALMDASPPRPLAVLDLLRGALAAHLRPTAALADLVDAPDCMRASVSGQLACWVLFAAAGFAFYNTTEDGPFTAAGHAHPLLGGVHVAIQVIAIVASAAVLVGALPLILAALSQARREPRLRWLVSLPPLAVSIFAGLTRGLALMAHSGPSRPSSLGGAAFLAWCVAGLACGAVSVMAARAALFAVSMPRRRLVTAFVFGTLVTVAMAAIALATAVYAIALFADAPRLAASANGPLQLVSTGVSLTVQLAVMLMVGTLAATTTRRGWRAVARG